MVYKTCSINKVLAQIYRDFKPSHSGWVQDAVEWIGDGIDIMRIGSGYTEQSCDIEVYDYRGKLPCELDVLLGVSYKGKRLQRNGSFNQKNLKHSHVLSLVVDKENSYTLNPNYINTSFHKGCITVYFLGIEKDCDGYPVVLDDAIYREALTWYVLMKMLGRGFKHQTFQYKDAQQMWNDTYPKAINRAKMFDLDGYRLFRRVWNGMTAGANDFSKTFYNSAEFKGAEPKKVKTNSYFASEDCNLILPNKLGVLINKIEDLALIKSQCRDEEYKEDFVGDFNYIGIALKDSNVRDSVWTIYRIEFLFNGTVTVKTLYNVKWTDRLILSF